MSSEGVGRTSQTHRFSAHHVTEVDDYVHVWGPYCKLPLPRGKCGQRHDHYEGSIQLMLVKQVGQEGDCLDRLPQSHLISKDDTVAPEIEKKKKKKVYTT